MTYDEWAARFCRAAVQMGAGAAAASLPVSRCYDPAVTPEDAARRLLGKPSIGEFAEVVKGAGELPKDDRAMVAVVARQYDAFLASPAPTAQAYLAKPTWGSMPAWEAATLTAEQAAAEKEIVGACAVQFAYLVHSRATVLDVVLAINAMERRLYARWQVLGMADVPLMGEEYTSMPLFDRMEWPQDGEITLQMARGTNEGWYVWCQHVERRQAVGSDKVVRRTLFCGKTCDESANPLLWRCLARLHYLLVDAPARITFRLPPVEDSAWEPVGEGQPAEAKVKKVRRARKEKVVGHVG